MFLLNILGQHYRKGDHVERSYEQAIYWYRLASSKGSYKAALELSYMFYRGNGVNVDYQKSLNWYRIARDNGLPYKELALEALEGSE